MALLHALFLLHKKYHWQLAVAHVNYGLRGKESTLDAQLVETTAKKLGLPFYQLTKKSLSQKSEEALRTIRYTFFEELVKKYHFDAVVLAHHQDDQAETVLLRLIRGSGSLGLSAMQMKRGIYVRPFLTFSKQEILHFLEQQNIPYRLDASNQERLYLRNKIRHELLPLLTTYNPRIKSTLANTASTLQQETSSSGAPTPFLVHVRKKSASFSLDSWQAMSTPQKHSLLRSLFQEKGLKPPTKALLETLGKDFSTQAKKGLNKEYSRLKLRLNNGMIDMHFKELD